MGRVYKAEDRELGTTVALKIIRPEYSSNPRIINRLKKETLLARSISHENIIRIHDIGEIKKVKFISMEYIEGQNLKELIQTSGNLTMETTIHITRQVCEALQAAHQRRIVHRDLKPHNIMIDRRGKAYVMDFGLAKSIEAQETTRPGAILGTPQYLSPEQSKGEKVDNRSDIYSLGIIMYEMLTGKEPFTAETVAGYIQKHIHETPPKPSEFNPLIPPFLDNIVLRCLEKDRKKRYQNAEEILEELKEQKVLSLPAKPLINTKKILQVTSAVALVSLVILVIFFLKWRKKPGMPVPPGGGRKSVAVMYFENNTGNKNLDHWRRAIQDLLITDLAQSRYLRVLPDDRIYNILKKLKRLETQQYSSEVLNKIASEENVDYFILGSFAKAGNSIRTTVKIRDASNNELIGTEIAEGKGEESFIIMVDKLTQKIKAGFLLAPFQIASDIDKEVGKITTSSPEALRYYVEGKQHFLDGNYQKSIEVLKKAVTIDPEFAMAYKRIAMNYDYLEYTAKAREYHRKALGLLNRVSDRERYLIQGYSSYILDKSVPKAVENYQKLLELYPEDEEGNLLLGSLYRYLEEWDLALEHFEKILQTNRKSQVVIMNIATIFMAKGWYNKARDILLSGENAFSNQASFHRWMSNVYLCQGKYDLALFEAEKAISLSTENYNNLVLLEFPQKF